MVDRVTDYCVICGQPSRLRGNTCSQEACRLKRQIENQRRYRERHPERVRERHSREMRELRAARKAGLKLSPPKTVRCVCKGCGRETFVEFESQKTDWCSTSCSNRRYVGQEAERFWETVDRSGGDNACWPWIGGRDFKDGRGRFWLNGTTVYASRAVWEFVYGPVPENLHVLHKCDNPPCCNPTHLFLGTLSDNTQDMLAKGRGRYGPNAPRRQE